MMLLDNYLTTKHVDNFHVCFGLFGSPVASLIVSTSNGLMSAGVMSNSGAK